ncbi:BTAD domain-containing putative transcriptional regulator [Streptomyces sp. EAG2]|uniref:BTAD domain-containing putative transcriptional regulator n=1 Tax=Streptomyces sp. EAG2 TaxID=2056495 RepID=UPI00117FC8D3|nr:BTAD domain-containing putative transcriptional regulator [Streptomyces sp. EAG2]
MYIRLLGPLEVLTAEGAPIALSTPRLRSLLALLALQPGRSVEASVLADQLWGGEVPPTARATVRTYVMRLRKALPPGSLGTGPEGYRLVLEETGTDIGRLRELLRRARESAAADPDSALALLDEAVRLRRGTPLTGVTDCPALAGRRAGLEELLLTAAEERFQLMLDRGRHQEAVAEIAEAARAHPLREHLAEQLILALHRCGRTAEALHAYRSLRELLVEELGVEPGARTRQLHQAILRGAPETGAPPDSPAPPAAPVRSPAFPAAHSTFVGRRRDLATLLDCLREVAAGPAICLVDGAGGVGKSSLTVRAATAVADRFPDGLLYVDLRGADPLRPPLDTRDALHSLLADLGVPHDQLPTGAEAASALQRRRLRGRRVLVVLDNALDAAHIAPLLPAEPGSAAIVTSRTPLLGVDGARHLHLDVLDPEEAVALVRTICVGAPEPDSSGEWAELVRLCGHLPLALRIIATRMAARPEWALGEWIAVLRDERGRMDQLAVADLDLRASLTAGIGQLARSGSGTDREAAAGFPYLGVSALARYLPGSLAALRGIPEDRAAAALDRLADAQLVTSPRPGAYTPHDLVRAAAVSEAARLPGREQRAALVRLARWWLGTLHAVNRVLVGEGEYEEFHRHSAARFPAGPEFTGTQAALTWAQDGLGDVIALAEQLAAPEYDGDPGLADTADARAPLSSFAVEVCRVLERYLTVSHNWLAQERLLATALRVAGRLDDDHARAVVSSQQGKVAGQRGEWEQAAGLLREGQRLFRSVGAVTESLVPQANLAPCLVELGRIDEAIEVSEAVIAARRDRGPSGSLCSLLNNLGHCYLHTGDLKSAERALTSALDVLAELEARTPSGRASTAYYRISALSGLTELTLADGDFAAAVEWAERGLEHADAAAVNTLEAARLHSMLADALLGLGHNERSRAAKRRSRELMASLNSREDVALEADSRAAGRPADGPRAGGGPPYRHRHSPPQE